MMKKLSQHDIDAFVAAQHAEIYGYVENIPADARQRKIRGDVTLPLSPDTGREFAQFFQEFYENQLFNGEASPTESFFLESLAKRFDISGMESAIVAAASRYDILLHQSQRANYAFLSKDFATYSQILATMKQQNSVLTAVVPVEEPEPSMTLQEAWDGFLVFKSDWDPKIRQENEKYFEVIREVLGADTQVNKITRRDIKSLLEAVAELPRQNKKPYNKMTVRECLDLDDVPEADLVSPRTVNGYLKLCQGLFSTYLTGEMDVLASSPTLNVRYEAHSKSYGDYSKTEMRRLVAHFKTLSGWKKWIPLLLAYTGARRAEIAKLKRSDVRLDDDSQRYYIMIDDTKTEAGTRQVPLSLHLLDLGFLDYVEGFSAGDSLFPDLTNFNQITHFFHDIREALEIPYLNDYGARRIVHSLRHTFITEARKTNELTPVQKVVGHEHSGEGQTQRYTHKFTVSNLLPVVDSIYWD
ncbi:tyrosine-type recombinase/integrase [Enterobacter sp.]|uniref:tyrosine-type recombinase/integrase n=1 Tax=Enterobacter sp. TaxID=42895 RepID=UPI0029132F86|nr:tyrosine-type recombinase/integrase [Enterobacter sp.]MDU7451945.1 tyrosine-type recombinase/integrase [Enterobacter sp.]